MGESQIGLLYSKISIFADRASVEGRSSVRRTFRNGFFSREERFCIKFGFPDFAVDLEAKKLSRVGGRKAPVAVAVAVPEGGRERRRRRLKKTGGGNRSEGAPRYPPRPSLARPLDEETMATAGRPVGRSRAIAPPTPQTRDSTRRGGGAPPGGAVAPRPTPG